jgi:catechol 2,3-dioxygenase-like lactoylglutathione lyase family enzyme
MIAHVSIGVKNVDRSKRFYDAALQPLGYRCLGPAKTSVGYGYGAVESRVAPTIAGFCGGTRRSRGHWRGRPPWQLAGLPIPKTQ